MKAFRHTGQAYVKRTIRPLYQTTPAIPFGREVDLDHLNGRIVYPGMVATYSLNSNLVTIASYNDWPCGLFGNFINGPLDEVGGMGECAIWKTGIFELLNNQNIGPIGGDGWWGGQLFWDDEGRIAPVQWIEGQRPLGRLLDVLSPSKVVIDISL